jgi:hypothetical protein
MDNWLLFWVAVVGAATLIYIVYDAAKKGSP